MGSNTSSLTSPMMDYERSRTTQWLARVPCTGIPVWHFLHRFSFICSPAVLSFFYFVSIFLFWFHFSFQFVQKMDFAANRPTTIGQPDDQ